MTILTSNFDGKEIDYFYCYKVDDYNALLDKFESSDKYKRLGLDIETCTLREWRGKFKDGALDPHTGTISVVTLVSDGTMPVIFDLVMLELQGYDKTRLEKFIRSREYIVAHNAKFEVKWLGHYFKGIFFKNFRCTLLMSNLISNATGSKFGKAVGHSLRDLARDILNVQIKGKGKEQVTDWLPRPASLTQNLEITFDDPGMVDWKSKLDYAVGDVLYLFPIHDELEPVLLNPLPPTPILSDGSTAVSDMLEDEEVVYGLGQGKVFELEMRMIAVSAKMEYNGMPICYNLLKSFQTGIYDPTDNSGILNELMAELCEDFGLEYYEDFISDGYTIPNQSEKALNNPKKLQALIQEKFKLKNIDSAQTSTIVRLLDLLDQAASLNDVEFSSEEEEEIYEGIKQLENSAIIQTNEIAKRLIRYKTLKKVHGMNLFKYINPATGCIHSSFNQAWAATGRSASSNPNQQNIPGRCYVTIEIEKTDNPFLSGAKI